MEQQYFTVKQTAELLGVSISTVRRRIRDGTFSTYKYFGRPLIPRKYIFEGSETNSRSN